MYNHRSLDFQEANVSFWHELLEGGLVLALKDFEVSLPSGPAMNDILFATSHQIPDIVEIPIALLHV